jgi:hypothetical protein
MNEKAIKYQVFISSTYEDLLEERRAVTWALMQSNRIPVGMEIFPATPDRGWETVQHAINVSDFFVLIVAGRYGDVEKNWDRSWTQHEYEYATSRGIPVLVFIREIASITLDKGETDPEKCRRLNAFCADLRRKHHTMAWKTVEELTGKIQNAISSQIESPYRKPPTGWYREVSPGVPSVVKLVSNSGPNLGKTNWVIVSQHSPFTYALREALEKQLVPLGIVHFPKFERPAEEHGKEYDQLLKDFMLQAPPGSWLFTNYPEDERNKDQRSKDREKWLIDGLQSQKKRMICFESGHNLWGRAERLVGHGNNPVGVVETDAGDAIERLVRRMTARVWSNVDRIEIVSVMGPQAANTQERGRRYIEFFSCVQHGLKRDGYEDICRDLEGKELCATVSGPLRTWLEEDCIPSIKRLLDQRISRDNSVHTTFLCGNDDLAVTVYKAANTMFPDDVRRGRVSLVGFDGMPAMDRLKEELGVLAATARVDFDKMVGVLIGWLQFGNFPAEPWPVPAAEVY